jgi:hypothetical protein
VAPGAREIDGAADSAATPFKVAESSCTVCAVTLPLFCRITVTLHPPAVLVITGAPPITMTTLAGPVETTKLTTEPDATLVPAIGLSLITLPEGTVGLLAALTVPTIRPAPVIALDAAA